MQISKTNRFLLLFNLSLLSLLFVFGLSSFFNYETPPQSKNISAAQAKAYFTSYLKTAEVVDGKLKAVFLDVSALNDLKSLMETKPKSKGIHVYFGEDEDENRVNMLITVDKDGKEDSSVILKSNGAVSICPKLCDTESPITQN